MPTRITDIIEPTVFAAYVIAETKRLSKLIESGIITQNDKLNSLVTNGGRTLIMPMWERIGGDSEVLSDIVPLTVDRITTKQDVATMLMRGRAWGANELASAVAGDSAIAAIATQVAKYWVDEEQKILVSTLKGVFDSPTMQTHVNDQSASVIDADLILDTKQLLGDSATQLVAMFVHSAVFTSLQKQNLIDYIPDARGEVLIPAYLGYRLIVDDSMPYVGNVYDTYLFANGVIGRGDGIPVDFTPVETDRDALQGDDFLINRRAFVLHPHGVRWVGNAAGETPSNIELETGINWEKVYEDKNLGLVMLRHTL